MIKKVNINKKNISGYIRILLSAVLWGMLPLFSRLLYASGFTAFQTASMRGYLAALLSAVLLLLHKDYREFHMKEIPFYLLYGSCAIGGAFILYALSMQILSTAMAAVLLYTGPAFVNILNRIFYKIPVTPLKAAALVMTFAGCSLVVQMYDFAAFKANIVGVLIGLGSGFCYSLTTVLGTKARSRHDGGMNARLILFFGAAAFCAVKPPLALPRPNMYQLLLCIGLAVICSVLPYMMYLSGMDCGIDGGIASIVATVEPVAATLFGVLVFRDQLELLQIIGIGIVLTGVILPIVYEKISIREI